MCLFNFLFSLASSGDIAIDDIKFQNCELPLPEPSCEGNEFQCDSGACVEQHRVCDYTDDCGDYSDERGLYFRFLVPVLT